MRLSGSTGLARATGLGFAAGLRTVTPLAALHLRGRAVPGRLGRLIVASAAAEMVADKLPRTPSRLAPFALAGRMTSGGVAGYAVAGRPGVATGAAAALAGAFLGHRARRSLHEIARWPDVRGAVVEDAFAVAVATVAAARKD